MLFLNNSEQLVGGLSNGHSSVNTTRLHELEGVGHLLLHLEVVREVSVELDGVS